MKTAFYTVVEVQLINGAPGVLNTVFVEKEGEKPAEARALSKYFSVLTYAALSEIEYHAAYIIRSDGTLMGEKIFDRRGE